MDVSPTMLREAEFRIALRGYSCEEVDQFLENAAGGLEGMQERLRQAVDRAQRAESAAAEAAAAAPPPPPAPAPLPSIDTTASDETLRKTLVLAQRTADLAVQEAREQAARILSAAESQAQARLTEAEERARRTHEDALSDIRAELTSLEVTRQRAQQDVDALNRWVEDHRTQITTSLSEALSHIERVGVRSPAPTSRPIDVPPLPRPAAPLPAGPPPGLAPGPAPVAPVAPVPPAAQRPAGPPPFPPAPTTPPARPSAEPARPGPAPTIRVTPRPAPALEPESGPPTVAWRPGDEIEPTPGQGTPAVAGYADEFEVNEEDQAFDDFFDDDEDGGVAGERRFGGRLRRRH